jgi:hypothetical protein
MFNKIIWRTIANGDAFYLEGENYINNAVEVYRHGNTIEVTEVCLNDYGRVFKCRGYIYELTFAPSELEEFGQGCNGVFRYEDIEG